MEQRQLTEGRLDTDRKTLLVGREKSQIPRQRHQTHVEAIHGHSNSQITLQASWTVKNHDLTDEGHSDHAHKASILISDRKQVTRGHA